MNGSNYLELQQIGTIGDIFLYFTFLSHIAG